MYTRLRRVTYGVPDGRLKIRWIVEKRVVAPWFQVLWLPCRDTSGRRYEFRDPKTAYKRQSLAAHQITSNPNDTEYNECYGWLHRVYHWLTMPHTDWVDNALDRGINEVNEPWTQETTEVHTDFLPGPTNV
ncbi:hypothetical protein AHIS2_p016 [Acaryochloris phage A-HIS2]|nr:hypothetical protein AHIS2_p016 [Acaryochloris phage A-HIS2]